MKKCIASLLCICMLLSFLPALQAAANDFDTEVIPFIDPQPIVLTLSVTGHAGENIVAPREVKNVYAGVSVLEVVKKVLEESGISYTMKGNYMSEIGGLKEFDYGKYSGWMYMVGGKYPSVPMGEYTLSGGETIALIYVESFVPDEKADISCAVIGGIAAKGYTGKALMQNLTVTLEGKALSEKKDYTLTYENNIKVGTARVIIQGCGQYTGTVVKTFAITLAKPAVKVAAVTAAAVKLVWNKVPGAQYYRVYEYNAGTKKYTHLAKTATTAFVHKNRAAGSAHYYLVKACFVNKAGKELCSPVAAKDCIKAVLLCKAPAPKAGVSGKTVALKWAKCAGAKFYRIYEYNTKTKKYTTIVKSTAAPGATLGKQAKGTHYYLVRAFNANSAGSAYTSKHLVKAVVK